ncbi:3-oxoacyl-[acyl-carrier protein] reductase [Geomicrobium halophilum]|uniref:3-oxoacyl-[acyl-carrier protein] reductase n=2 Tax=Geomicrobium halophilum TaxID=549000 RepID=A0A841PLP8_9BACL|nr:3-oxoacyl-[acyl-carrier protein] reductase [Geomicrobium halophilum]
MRTTAEKFGSIDGGPPAGTFKDFTDDDWQQSFELQLLSYIRSIREVLSYMQKQKGGRIINIASSSIKQPIDNLILSNTFRNGIAGLAKSLASELATDNILINTIGPGIIKTNRVSEIDKVNAQKARTSTESIELEKLKQIPIGRYGEPDEFAKFLVYLASFANTYVTGQSLLVEGGMVKALLIASKYPYKDENNETFLLDKSSLTERIYDYLRNQIVQNQMAPGTRINYEQLANELNVSRMPLREAVNQLSQGQGHL